MRCIALVLLATVAHAQAEPTVLATGFDDLLAGPLSRVRLAGAELRAAPGHAEIHAAHHRSPPHALRIHGGQERTVEIRFDRPPGELGVLSFHAERWTRRSPFAFRVDTRGPDRWRTVWTGDRSVTIGRFPSAVRVPLGEAGPIHALRLVATAPDGGGVLIDDLELTRPAVMRIAGVRQRAPALPILVGSADAPVLEVRIDARGDLEPLDVTRVELELADTGHPADLESLRIVLDGAGGAAPFGTPRAAAGLLTFEVRGRLRHGTNLLHVLATASERADLDRRIAVRCARVVLSDATRHEPRPDGEPRPQRFALALRRAGEDGVHTSRIPALARTRDGTLIAAFDLRHRSARDLPGDIDVGVRRSTDGGRSWERTRVALDMGEPHVENGAGDPCVLVDGVSGRVWLFALWSRGDTGWNGSKPGLDPGVTGQLVATWSDDDGATWAAPRNLTRELKEPGWRLFLQGPGMGITTHDGVLVVPAQFRDGAGLPHSTVFWSDDRGATWHVGTGARPDTTESQVVELRDGAWMLNMRDNRGSSRAVAITRDRGRTWTPHATTRAALPEPVCMASLIRFPRGAEGFADDLLLFSNPAVAVPPRRRTTMRHSRDDGATWSAGLLLDEGVGAGYSCLAPIDEDTVGILYEGSRAQLTFQRIPIAELLAR